MAECSFARCQQERRAIRKELQRWTKNMVYILGLERVAEELMGRRKWKQYQNSSIARHEQTSDEDSMPSTEQTPALKIKTIQQINEDERPEGKRPETILESLIKRPATQPRLDLAEEPADWQPPDKCYFCTDDKGDQETAPQGAASPGGSESDSSEVSGAKSPPAPAPPLLQHLLQLHAQNPQAITQFQQMMATLAALGTGMLPPPFAQTWMMPRMMHRNQSDTSGSEEKGAPASPSPVEQPLDLSAKSTSSTSGTPPPDNKALDNRLKRVSSEGCGVSAKRAYSEEEVVSAVREVQAGRLGTRRAALLYGIPRSTLRNKLHRPPDPPLSPDTAPDSPPSVILKIPTFPPPEDTTSPPAAPVAAPVTPLLPPPQPPLAAQPLMLPPSVFADPPTPQHLFTSISDVIAKSISLKFQQPAEGRAPPEGYLRDRHVSVIKPPAGGAPPRPPPTNNGQPAGGKGTRPKRGKYRNYDRDSLVEAVKAVQRGEMSVHRAGSYYGVPHSTLEYKVKERHLMRPRKRDPKPQPDTKPQPPKPQPPKPPAAKPFTNGLNGPEGAYGGYGGFWAGGGRFAPPAPDLYASHMMRRLREEAPPVNGSFLEGIIRSSLGGAGSGGAGSGGGGGAGDEGGRLAAEMREAVQRLRADKLRPRSGSSSPPAAPPVAPPAAPPDCA